MARTIGDASDPGVRDAVIQAARGGTTPARIEHTEQAPQPATPATRGMLNKVSYMVQLVEES